MSEPQNPTIISCTEIANRILLIGHAERLGMEREEAEKMPTEWLNGYVMDASIRREHRFLDWLKS